MFHMKVTVGFTLGMILMSRLVMGQNPLRDCRKLASITTKTPIADIEAQCHRDLDNGNFIILWEAKLRLGGTVSGFCEANPRNGLIARFEGSLPNSRSADAGDSMAGFPNLIRATIQRGGDEGKCTFEVQVHGVADVEIAGEHGRLQTLSGHLAKWRRLDCNQPLPTHPVNFRFNAADHLASQKLIRHPGSNHGTAVIRIENHDGESGAYTGDIIWRRSGL